MAQSVSTISAIPTISDLSSIQAYNRGPITSLLTLPSSCTATVTDPQQKKSVMFFGHENDPYFDISCLPVGTMMSLDLVKSKDKWSLYYYSPGICPYGWTTATTFQSQFPGFSVLHLGPQTTAALCCPSGYGYVDQGHRCKSIATQDQRVRYVSPTANGADGWIRGSVSTSTVALEMTVYGDGVPVWWQSSDEAIFAVAGSTTISASTPLASSLMHAQTSAQSSKLSPSDPSNSVSASTQQEGLSGGAKAGIGVGIAVGVLVAMLAVILFCLRRRNKGTQETQEIGGLPELGGVGPAEKPADNVPQEMAVQTEPAELHAYPQQ